MRFDKFADWCDRTWGRHTERMDRVRWWLRDENVTGGGLLLRKIATCFIWTSIFIGAFIFACSILDIIFSGIAIVLGCLITAVVPAVLIGSLWTLIHVLNKP